jgi:prepilin-type N-terminal cleavage/methylation domain-containing protein
VNRKGVTLIELIVVMVIIGIGALLIAPNISAWLPNYKLRSATRDIVSTMRTAQMKAVSRNLDYEVSFTQNVDGSGSYILKYNTGGSWVIEGKTTNKFPSGITIDAISFPGNNAQFNKNYTASAGSITLKNNKAKKKISVTTSTGKIKIE